MRLLEETYVAFKDIKDQFTKGQTRCASVLKAPPPPCLSDPSDVEWDTRPIQVWGWRASLVIEVSKWRHF